MQPAEREHVFDVFEAFLRYSREATVDVRDLSTVITEVRSSAFVPGSGASPSAGDGLEPVHVAEASVVIDDENEVTLDAEITRISAIPSGFSSPAPATPLPPPTPSVALPALPADGSWEEPTHEQASPQNAATLAGPGESTGNGEVDLSETLSETLPVVLPSSPPQIAMAQSQSAPRESSIIVDDDTLTDPEFGPELAQRFNALGRAGVGTPTPVEPFLQELSVLIKYGHAEQARGEAEHWVAAHPDALSSHILVAEFELSRLDREAGLRRFGRVITTLTVRGDNEHAMAALARLERVAPGEPRVAALGAELGLR